MLTPESLPVEPAKSTGGKAGPSELPGSSDEMVVRERRTSAPKPISDCLSAPIVAGFQ
jgi:hypothetical protein